MTAIAPTLVAGAKPAPIVPTTFEDCYRFGKLLAVSGLVPRDYIDKPEACTVALMQGLELGLSPMAAIQSIAVINGRPSLWGDGVLAVIRASGLMEWIKETHDGETAICRVKRKGEKATIERRFSQDDAKRAGLATKTGPWTQYPGRMRAMRARAWALRDGFADVLKGMSVAEEVADTLPMKDITPAREPAPLLDIPDDIPEMPADAPPNTPDELPEIPEDAPISDVARFLAKLREDRGFCQSEEEVRELAEANADLIARLPPDKQQEARSIFAIEE